MCKSISRFRGEYEFLSNFAQTPFVWSGTRVLTAEHAFQACKCAHEEQAIEILEAATPAVAKRLGRKAVMISCWDEIRIDAMRDVLRAKFNPQLQRKLCGRLADTDPLILVEGNSWHDNFWGNCQCRRCQHRSGLNWLGKLLMQTRDEVISWFGDECWIRYHETGACYDTDYEAFCEKEAGR